MVNFDTTKEETKRVAMVINGRMAKIMKDLRLNEIDPVFMAHELNQTATDAGCLAKVWEGVTAAHIEGDIPTVAELEALPKIKNPYRRVDSYVLGDITYDVYEGLDGRRWKCIRGGWGGDKTEKALLVI